MIQSKADLKRYIECDLKSLGSYPLSIKTKVGGDCSLIRDGSCRSN